MNALKFIYKNLDHFKTKFIVVFLTGILDGFATFFIPVVLAEFTKGGFTNVNFVRLIIWVVGFYVASLVFQWVIRKWGESMGQQFGNHVRLKYFKSLEKLPLRNLINYHSGYILSLINKVSDGITPIVVDIFWTFAKSISHMILFFYFTARESVVVGIVNLVLLMIFVWISMLFSKTMVPIADELNKKKASLIESYTDFMSNILTVKRLGIYSFVEKTLFRKTNENDQQIQKLRNFHANRWFVLHALFGMAFLSTIGFLLYQVSTGAVSASILILFVAAYALIRGNVERLSENVKSLMEMRAYLHSLEVILEPGKGISDQGTSESLREITFKDIFFQYAGTEKKILIPHFTISAKEKICIMGKSGEGKSTLLNLVTNFLIPTTGERSLNGKSYGTISGKFFQNHITIISQETELFNISLRENITLGQTIDEQVLLDIFDKLDLLPWVMSLDQGLDTLVGEKGIKLSAGQKQRINLARGILLNREIILLDEPTSHLDAATEAKVVHFLAEYLATKTAIIVTHRESLKSLCTRSYLVKDHVMVDA